MGWPAALGFSIRFLTVLSPPGSGDATADDVARSLYMFPVVGLLIGALSSGAGAAALYLFGEPVHAVAVVVAGALVTAGLHLDGLADTCDALSSRRDREQKLRIMRDSRIGALGATALILVLALKIAALLALGDGWWVGALVSPAFGRWVDLYGITRFPAARNGGLAAGVRTGAPDGQLRRATLLMALMAAPLFLQGAWYTVVVALTGAFLAVHWLAAAASRSLGGLTGDVYGALSEFGEVAALLALCVIMG